ncbi:hypothetical protein K1719_037050 [Acacia pycnantha]|nr:hypothetical protein K1719_037050 [Acacia pycnantha]
MAASDCGGRQIAYTITVGGSYSQFKTVQAAIDSISTNNARWVKIHIYPGKYTEQVQIPYGKSCIFLEGEGRAVTTITYNGHQQTDISATFSSFPSNIVAAGINFENSWDLSAGEDQSFQPAVAARIYGDKSAFIDCGFLGFQDTLWDVQGRHYFKNCYIEGAVDFIFGSGQSYYENCFVNVSLSTSNAHVGMGYITAQGRGSKEEASGFVFKGGMVVGSGVVMLGRAYGPYSRVIFHETYLHSVVHPQGWDAWNYGGNEKNLMYMEVNCTGPGASLKERVKWVTKLISALQLQQFSLSSFIDQDRWLAYLPRPA